MLTLLGTLKDSGYLLGIASSKPEHLIYDVANYLDITKYFDAVVGVKTDNSNHSSKTSLILEAMEKLGAKDKSQVLMVGDRHYDITGAKGAGVSSCGCLWGYGNKQEFLDCGADFVVSDPLEILKLIN
ncbi:MAG: HAD hydrolase-like protein [Clostridia bacterium]|nr:HAD hydrolase-like protein [Clostridia bacterium]